MRYHWPSGGRQALPAHRPGHSSGIIAVLQLLYHNRGAIWYNWPSGREQALPAHRPGHNSGIIAVLQLLYHIIAYTGNGLYTEQAASEEKFTCFDCNMHIILL